MTRSQRVTTRVLILLPFAAALAGCPANVRQDDSAMSATTQASPEQRARLRERLAQTEGWLVGDVEAANDTYAIVGGIDPKMVGRQSRFHFRDPADNSTIAGGNMLSETAGGRIAIRFQAGTRPPRVGDLAIVQKATAP